MKNEKVSQSNITNKNIILIRNDNNSFADTSINIDAGDDDDTDGGWGNIIEDCDVDGDIMNSQTKLYGKRNFNMIPSKVRE